MNKRMKQMMGGAVIGTTLTAMAAIGAGQMASASGNGTCLTTAIFLESGTCTVLAGEVVEFTVQGGSGGPGGNGGWGGYGRSFGPYPGGRAGEGGQGGSGGSPGRGAEVVGSYINSTDATVTLTVVVGTDGLGGSEGDFGVSGSALTPDGSVGGDGGDGTAGTESSILIDDLVIVSAQGGTGGTGGKGGTGGTGATGEVGSADGISGTRGENGLDGVNGSYAPVPLPPSWIYTEEGLNMTSVRFRVGRSETLLPATGSDTSPTMWVTLLVLASGAAFVVVARRRVVR